MLQRCRCSQGTFQFRSSLRSQQLYKDLQHDRLVSILNTEKDLASKKYFEKLIAKGNKPAEPKQPQQEQLLSPIESLFHRYLKKSLGSYNEYLKVLFTLKYY